MVDEIVYFQYSSGETASVAKNAFFQGFHCFIYCFLVGYAIL